MARLHEVDKVGLNVNCYLYTAFCLILMFDQIVKIAGPFPRNLSFAIRETGYVPLHCKRIYV